MGFNHNPTELINWKKQDVIQSVLRTLPADVGMTADCHALTFTAWDDKLESGSAGKTGISIMPIKNSD